MTETECKAENAKAIIDSFPAWLDNRAIKLKKEVKLRKRIDLHGKEKELAEAINLAVKVHNEQLDILSGLDETREELSQLEIFATSLKNVILDWDKLSEKVQAELSWHLHTSPKYFDQNKFIDTESKNYPIVRTEDITDYFQGIIQYLQGHAEEFAKMAKRPEGNDNQSRDKEAADKICLVPLYYFASVIKDFWVAHTDYAFNPEFEENDDANIEERQAGNLVSHFFVECAKYLDVEYSIGNFDTAMRNSR